MHCAKIANRVLSPLFVIFVISGLVSICVEIPCIDLFQVYELLINQYPFSSFWEESDGISYIAFDKCEYFTLDGPKRFEVANEFNS